MARICSKIAWWDVGDAHETRQAIRGQLPKQADGDVGVQCTISQFSCI